jgi:hypothetical protein
MIRGHSNRSTQDGFATVFVIITLILVIGAISASAYALYRQHHNKGQTASTNTSNHGHSSSHSIATCSTSKLKLSISNQSGAAGTMYMNADVTNTGASSCKLTGYPTVFLADSTGSTTGMGAEASSDYTPTSITLTPGSAAHSLLAFPNAGNFGTPGICSAASVNLYFYPPASTTYLQLPLVQHACPGFRATALKAGI